MKKQNVDMKDSKKKSGESISICNIRTDIIGAETPETKAIFDKRLKDAIQSNMYLKDKTSPNISIPGLYREKWNYFSYVETYTERLTNKEFLDSVIRYNRAGKKVYDDIFEGRSYTDINFLNLLENLYRTEFKLSMEDLEAMKNITMLKEQLK